MSERKSIASVLVEEKGDGWFSKNIVAHAPLIVGIFANLVVIVADYRAFDVVYHLTGVIWKALAASLACAIPFVLWEIAWQYNYTTNGWRVVSLLMAGLAFATSLLLGVADYIGLSGSGWGDALLAGVVLATGVHTVAALLYYYNDPDVALRRHKAQALALGERRKINADLANQLLLEGRGIVEKLEELERQFSPDDVKAIMQILDGKSPDTTGRARQGKQNQPAPKPQLVPTSAETKQEQLRNDGQHSSNPPKAGQQ